MRRGKKRAIHIPGVAVQITGGGPFTVTVEKSIVGGPLCVLEIDAVIEKGPVWIVITPLKENSDNNSMLLSELKEMNEREVVAAFDSSDSFHKRTEILLDRRGRVKNLELMRHYTVTVMPPQQFFQAYERRSIPAGNEGRSEPDETGLRRIELFADLCDAHPGDMILDCATGIKDYLKGLVLRKSKVVCLNVSTPILERTKEWLGYKNAHFVRYDVELGFPFRNEVFDCVIVDALLEYTKDPLTVLRKCGALIRPGGRVIVLEPAITEGLPEFYPQDMWELALWRPKHDSTFTRASYVDVMKREGFKFSERRVLRFKYTLFKEEEFSQGIALFEKTP